jgi:hypothetical protein
MTEPDETTAGPDAGPLTAEQVPQLIPPQPEPAEEAAEAEAEAAGPKRYVKWVGSPYIDKGLTEQDLAGLGVDPVDIPDGGIWWTRANRHRVLVEDVRRVLTEAQMNFYIGTEQGRFVVVEENS